MDTDTCLYAPSAGASSARADGAPAITATEHDQHMESTTELAASSGSGSAACTTQTLERCLYDLLKFFSAAIKDVSRASAPHWFSLDEECDILIRDFFDVWNNTGAMHYFALFSQPLLLKHKEIFDVLRYDKNGAPRDSCFLKWCRRVHALREAYGAATEHAESSDDQEKQCYNILGEDMLLHDLLPHQSNDPTYQIQYNSKGIVSLSGNQRSWISLMLRKNLGHKNVARFILQNGLPELFDAPLREEKPSQEQLQSILANGVTWYASLLLSLVEHDRRPGLAHARQMSTLEPDFRRQKQQAHLDAKQALAKGKRLCEDRDSRKRTYSEMSATERRILDDFDAKNLHTRVAETKCAVDKTSFHGSISFWDLGQPAMPEGALSKSPSAPPHILDKPIPKSIQACVCRAWTAAECATAHC